MAANAPSVDVCDALRPGWLGIGVRYLWIDLGRTSSGDVVSGNSAGLVADLGYKITF